MSVESKKTRIKNSLGMFDMLKGVMMILVLLYHTYGLLDCIDSNSPFMIIVLLLYILGGLSMPALFIVSGYGFRKMKFKKCLKKQFNTLVVPYIITTFITCFVHCISYYLLYGGKRVAIKETLKVLFAYAIGLSKDAGSGFMENVACGPIWFLLALVVSNLVFNQLLQYFEGKKLLIASAVVSCIGWLVSYIIALPWSFNQGLVATFYVALGYYAKKTRFFTSEISLKMKLIVLIAFATDIICIIFFNGFDMASNKYGAGILTIVAEGILSIALIYAFLLMNNFRGRVSSILRYIGRVSIYVLAIHNIEMMGAGKYIQYDFTNNWQGNLLLRSIIIFGVRVLVVMAITYAFVLVKEKVVITKLFNTTILLKRRVIHG